MTILVNHLSAPETVLILGDGPPRECARAEVDSDTAREVPGRYAVIARRFHGVHASVEGPVFFVDDFEAPIVPGRFRGVLDRTAGSVHFVLFDEDRPVYEIEYAPEAALEVDPHTGRPLGLFEWLKGELMSPTFFERHLLP